MHNIHWNSTNPLFNPRMATENIIQVNGGNHPWEYDQVNIVCPVYPPGSPEQFQERYIIYSVTKQEYETCRIVDPNPRIIAVCDRPHELMYFTLTIRSFSPTPGAIEFRVGQSYYFLSTSSKNDIHRRVGGGCSTHNMKITLKVAEPKPILTIEENHLQQHHSRPSVRAKPSATLYYPLHEIAQMKEFFFKRKPTTKMMMMQADDPNANLTSSAIKHYTSLLLLLIISCHAIML